MKLRDASTNEERGARVVLGPNIAEEKKNAPTLDEIRQRATEIHIERGSHGGDIDGYLDAWLQAERELQEKYNKSKDGGPKKK